VFNIETTDFREPSRYVLEDMLKSHLDDKFLILIAKDSTEYAGIPKDAAKLQREAGIGGDECKISGLEYYCLKGRISNCPKHDEIRLYMSESQFLGEFYDGGGGLRYPWMERTNPCGRGS